MTIHISTPKSQFTHIRHTGSYLNGFKKTKEKEFKCSLKSVDTFNHYILINNQTT